MLVPPRQRPDMLLQNAESIHVPQHRFQQEAVTIAVYR